MALTAIDSRATSNDVGMARRAGARPERHLWRRSLSAMSLRLPRLVQFSHYTRFLTRRGPSGAGGDPVGRTR